MKKTLIKNKKIFFIIFLFLIVSGLIIPQISKADWNPVCWQWLWGNSEPGSFHYNYCYYSAENNQVVLDVIEKPIKQTFAALILAVATIIIAVAGSLATLAADLVRTIIGASSSVCYTCFDNKAIATGWPMVRDLANMFIVLGFVIIGIATTLRIQDYQAKKLLPKLIIAALLINFSLVICGIFIDGSNIAMKSFLQGGGFLESAAIKNVSNQTSAIWSTWKEGQPSAAIGTAVGIAFYDIVLFVTFMLFFFLFLFRYMALWILVILSPLAFVCYVFPFTKNVFSMWWSNFLQWCIIGIPAGLFMLISDKIAASFLTVDPNNANAQGGLQMLGYLVPATFLIMGFLISLKTSAMGASSAIGIAKGAIGLSGKAGMSTLKGLANKTGLSQGANAVKTGATRLGESLGLVSRGTSAGMEAKRLDEPKKRLANLDSKSLAGIAQQSAWGKKRSEDKAAATQLLADRNDLNDIKDENTRASAVAHASSFPGVKRTDFEKSDYKMAAYNDKKVQTYKTNHPTVSKADAIEAVKIEQLKTNLPQMSGGQLRDIDHDDLFHNSDIIRENFTPHMITQFKTATPDRIKVLKDTIGLPTTPGYLAHDHAQAVASGNKAEATRLQKVMDSINKL